MNSLDSIECKKQHYKIDKSNIYRQDVDKLANLQDFIYRFTGLEEFKHNGSKLNKLYLNKQLERLECSNNLLSELKIYHLDDLKELNCSDNSLKKLSLYNSSNSSNSSNLEILNYLGNELVELYGSLLKKIKDAHADTNVFDRFEKNMESLIKLAGFGDIFNDKTNIIYTQEIKDNINNKKSECVEFIKKILEETGMYQNIWLGSLKESSKTLVSNEIYNLINPYYCHNSHGRFDNIDLNLIEKVHLSDKNKIQSKIGLCSNISRSVYGEILFLEQTLRRVEADKESLKKKFGLDGFELVDIEVCNEEGHNRGKCICFLHYRDQENNLIKIVYKPRTIEKESLLIDSEYSIFKDNDLVTLKTLVRDDNEGKYGYIEFVYNIQKKDVNVSAAIPANLYKALF